MENNENRLFYELVIKTKFQRKKLRRGVILASRRCSYRMDQ